jgi:hypothetical protein
MKNSSNNASNFNNINKQSGIAGAVPGNLSKVSDSQKFNDDDYLNILEDLENDYVPKATAPGKGQSATNGSRARPGYPRDYELPNGIYGGNSDIKSDGKTKESDIDAAFNSSTEDTDYFKKLKELTAVLYAISLNDPSFKRTNVDKEAISKVFEGD